MDPNNIFNLFDDENTSKTVESTGELGNKLKEFRDSPIIKIGMFTKLIVNHFTFHTKLEKFLKEEEPSYNVESTREASEFVVFNRAFHYLNQINPLDKEVIFAILDFDDEILGKTLESAITYFETLEEYEKCAHIFKFQKILRESKR